ncbi:hypothetical protein NADFUDRAFT_49222 [Nadsonia fulvescens var. elongata DSM 6958]|uniref:S-adenosyl-L-methionine-dependent methyltransferase n=1 Tax=Nadsonia fulvescens var. elongata DSM 6958 TaxID=857566 RepID=A0A1E3PTJ5_9ASCO|nr:hypothetical protein NADFUDRAFT_49222 [Nadsonia fulvescens var. elongata DSM 6958]
MLPTPLTTQVPYDLVYEPAEDSFLLLDHLEEDLPFLRTRFPRPPTGPNPAPAAGYTPVVVELGTGSGIVTTFMHNSIFPDRANGPGEPASAAVFLATDLNPFALQSLQNTSCENGGTRFLDPCRMSLGHGLRPHLVDVLVFNPPYVPDDQPVPAVPATEDRKDPGWLDLALLGGEDGMDVTWVLLNDLDTILSPQGVAYILFCKRNKPEQVAEIMVQRGWHVHRIGERKAGWEVLSVWRFTKY